MPPPAADSRVSRQANYQINYQIPNLPNYQLQVFA